MKFAQLGARGSEIPVVVQDGEFYDLRSVTARIDGDFLSGDISRVASLLADGELPILPEASSQRVGPPIARPTAILCIGMNYAAHAAETGAPPPENMIVFTKHPNTMVGPNDDVTIPRGSVKTDWEVELGIVIGTLASQLDSPADSADHIAGYVVVNDLSERAWQMEVSGGQWGKGKSAPGFAPTGPWLVTPDAIDVDNLRLQSRVNGEARQDSNTSDMIFSPAHIVWELSQYMDLEPGDLILTGTPEGVGISGRYPYLKAGDSMEVEIEQLGLQKHSFIAHEAEGA